MKPSRLIPLYSVVFLACLGTPLLFTCRGDDPAQAQTPAAPAEFRDPDSIEVEIFRRDGIVGGRLEFLIHGSPDQVLSRLLAFEEMAGHRSWAEEFKVLSRDEDEVVATWQFRGRLGIKPKIDITFRVHREADETLIRYHTSGPTFGLKRFFGEYRVEAADEHPGISRLTQEVFIDSGLPLLNASEQDIKDGLREDARQLRGWLAPKAQSVQIESLSEASPR